MQRKWIVAAAALFAASGFVAQTGTIRGDAPANPRVAADRDTYNVGDEVWLEVVFPSSGAVPTLNSFLVSVRYAGEEKLVLDGAHLGTDVHELQTPNSTGYHPLLFTS